MKKGLLLVGGLTGMAGIAAAIIALVHNKRCFG